MATSLKCHFAKGLEDFVNEFDPWHIFESFLNVLDLAEDIGVKPTFLEKRNEIWYIEANNPPKYFRRPKKERITRSSSINGPWH